jgi:hypothetical protein
VKKKRLFHITNCALLFFAFAFLHTGSNYRARCCFFFVGWLAGCCWTPQIGVSCRGDGRLARRALLPRRQAERERGGRNGGRVRTCGSSRARGMSFDSNHLEPHRFCVRKKKNDKRRRGRRMSCLGDGADDSGHKFPIAGFVFAFFFPFFVGLCDGDGMGMRRASAETAVGRPRPAFLRRRGLASCRRRTCESTRDRPALRRSGKRGGGRESYLRPGLTTGEAGNDDRRVGTRLSFENGPESDPVMLRAGRRGPGGPWCRYIPI